MSAIQLLSAQPWVERLAWTLLHFLWQGVVIAAAYAAMRKWIARSAGPDRRYALGCAALIVMAAAPLITWSLKNAPVTVTAPASTHSASTTSTQVSEDGSISVLLRAAVPQALSEPLAPWVVALWFAGATVLWFRLLNGWIRAMRLRSRHVRPAPAEWQQALNRLKARIRVSRPVRFLVSSLVQTPAVVGWLRPVVLVPVGALTGLAPQQVEALLLHELAHIRRHDYLVNVLQSIVEALLFYHPAVWWVSGHIRAEREQCCDDVAVSVSGDVLTYARALAELESAHPAHLRTAMAATGGSLADRIARLLGHTRPASRTISGPGILGAAILLALTAFAVFGQPASRLKFEAASIKPSSTPNYRVVRPLPGRLTADAPVRQLMQNAYTFQPFQIVGGPDWIDSAKYEIEAKADGNANRAQVFLMLQSLLEDRFQLKTHRETRELPVYSLVVAKNGPKLPRPTEGVCEAVRPEDPPEWAGVGRMRPPDPSQTVLPRCESVNVALAVTGVRMQGGKIPMAEFVRMLSTVLDRTVIDKTGFKEPFDLRLDFLPDTATPTLPAPPPGAIDALNSNPSIFSAIQEQLGLRLESAKGPVEVLVIDQIERPSAN